MLWHFLVREFITDHWGEKSYSKILWTCFGAFVVVLLLCLVTM